MEFANEAHGISEKTNQVWLQYSLDYADVHKDSTPTTNRCIHTKIVPVVGFFAVDGFLFMAVGMLVHGNAGH
jgi:hypothetical protein